MSRKDLLEELENYISIYPEEQSFRDKFLDLIENYENCFDRSLSIGHITASSWIVNETRSHALLTHHAKLNLWLQLGGHVDGDSDILNAALREAQEESGLENILVLKPSIYDIDIHKIPARKHEPEHYHYDIRYLFMANQHDSLIVSNESKDLKWVALEKIPALVHNERSITRMVEKPWNEFNLRFGVEWNE